MIKINQGFKYFGFGYILLFITFFSALAFSYFSYEEIVQWYQNTYPHFYKNDEWTSAFFTIETYSFGQKYSWSLFILGLIFMLFMSNKQPNEKSKTTYFNIYKTNKYELFILIISILSWWFWQERAAYSTDEIFSAVHFSSYPILQTASHYPLPNNHIFFNIINNLLSFSTSNLVLSGRIISGIAISVLMIKIFRFSYIYIKNPIVRISIVIVLLTLFPVMGFSTQARGYGLQMLLGFIALFNIYQYQINRRHIHLIYFVISSVLGFWTLPSFLYFWIGISSPFIIKMLIDKKLDYAYIKAIFQIIWSVLVVYLPVVVFSGWRSILKNKYVVSEDVSYGKFLSNIWNSDYFKGLFNEWFVSGEYPFLGLIIFLIPIAIGVLYRKHPTSKILWYIISAALSFILIMIFMKKIPFYRNMVIHCLLFWFISLIYLSGLIEIYAKKFIIVWVCMLLSISAFFTYENLDRFPFLLYYYDVNNWNESLQETEMDFFDGKKVFIEDESFYWYFPVSQATTDIRLGGIINEDFDFLIIERDRQAKIDTNSWEVDSKMLESQVWKRKHKNH
ncbi:MAG: hypothetical protein JJU02_14680 [Cryomorphaceae bacterium]|nr:hypothetical protein [Cryomorphaceae bacterium]